MRLLKSSIVALCLLLPIVADATMVRLQTALGVIDIALYDTQAPLTVANFLNYANSGTYSNSFIHRSVPGFIIQGGGFTYQDAAGFKQITTGTPVKNEFSASRSNLRGTIAMAKLGGDPDSATSQWFINLADNAANLDNQNGGFTVFGRVMGNGMAVADAIASLQQVNASSLNGAFTNLPITSVPASGSITLAYLVTHLAMVTSVTVLSPSDCLFNWAELTYPEFFSPAGATSGNYQEYYYRYYSTTGNYLATSSVDNYIWLLGPVSGNGMLKLAPMSEFLGSAGCSL